MERRGRKRKEEGKKSSLSVVKSNLKRLTFDELEQVIALAMRYRKDRLGNEELRLLREKEELELKLKDLKTVDKELNAF
ncbi:hypothetical protein [Parabacteroides sp. PF5-6]|uniref:hypothetical protein n=1 Tax=Parabacteroides sp. PF5-6 TaxID=1742403 RepID=UPI00240736FD|nr:hypothetical protein [Parabacteroides sp. PF5-6]MDF9828796.1 hypothetical protein [Parabacteroides sp. PF5-6]